MNALPSWVAVIARANTSSSRVMDHLDMYMHMYCTIACCVLTLQFAISTEAPRSPFYRPILAHDSRPRRMASHPTSTSPVLRYRWAGVTAKGTPTHLVGA